MSHIINDALFERAAVMVDYWTDKLPAQLIEADIERNDLEALYYHVCAAEAMASEQEFEANDAY